jgi:methyl-accepting chemotaxis protein
MEELSSMVRLSVEHGKKASELAEDIHHKAQGGAQKLQQLQQAMGEIQSGSEQVQSIVSLIEDIAFQTNLLALNAAVEAARAGEQGRGFAVVAEAVRALAQKSQVAAKDIAELIQANMRKVGAGGAVTEEAVTYFEEILQAIENLNTINKELATSFQEQARGLDNINQALGQIDQAVQQNAATSEEAKLVSQNVYQFSEQVKTSLDDLCRVVRESA